MVVSTFSRKSFANISVKIIFGVYFSKHFCYSICIFWNYCTKWSSSLHLGVKIYCNCSSWLRARLSIRLNGSTYDLTRSKVTVTVSNKENLARLSFYILSCWFLFPSKREGKKKHFLTRFLWLNKGISSDAEQIINIIFETISHNVSNLRARIDDEYKHGYK